MLNAHIINLQEDFLNKFNISNNNCINMKI